MERRELMTMIGRFRTENDFLAELMPSLNRALLGHIGPALRKVAVHPGWENKEVTIVAVFDGPVSERDKEDMEVTLTEVIADFPEVPGDIKVHMDVRRIDYPESLSGIGMITAFLRRE
jgi:hypothetical protein